MAPSLDKLFPVIGPVVSYDENLTVSLYGRNFGTESLAPAVVLLTIREEVTCYFCDTTSIFMYISMWCFFVFDVYFRQSVVDDFIEYETVRLRVTPSFRSDDTITFELPELKGAQVLTSDSQTALLSVLVGGVECTTQNQLPFR